MEETMKLIPNLELSDSSNKSLSQSDSKPEDAEKKGLIILKGNNHRYQYSLISRLKKQRVSIRKLSTLSISQKNKQTRVNKYDSIINVQQIKQLRNSSFRPNSHMENDRMNRSL